MKFCGHEYSHKRWLSTKNLVEMRSLAMLGAGCMSARCMSARCMSASSVGEKFFGGVWL